jgi:hypothetical protein
VIFYRTLLDDLRRADAQYCSDCLSPLRKALIEAAEKGDRNFLTARTVARTGSPTSTSTGPQSGGMMLFSSTVPLPGLVALLCIDCARAHPEPEKTLPGIARMLLRQSSDTPSRGLLKSTLALREKEPL